MKKFVLGTLACAIAATVITPKVVSLKLEDQLAKSVQQINAVPGYKAELENMANNWFDTSGKIKLSINPEDFGVNNDNGELESFYLSFNVNAKHGPILPNSAHPLSLLDMSIELDSENLRDDLTWDANSSLYQANIITSIGGNTEYNDEIKSFSMKDEANNFSAIFDGFAGAGTINGDSFTYQGLSKSIRMSADQQEFEISGIEMNMTADATFADMLKGNLYDSDTKFTMKSLTLKDENKAVDATINNLYVEAITKVNNAKETGDISITYGIDSVNVDEVNVEDIALTIEVNNISKTFVTAYQDSMKTLSQGSDEEQQEKLVNFAQDNLLSLLKSEPEINITQLKASFDDGKIESHMNSSVKGITQLPNILENPMYILQHVIANGEVKGNKAVIERFAANQVESQIKLDPSAAEMTEAEIESIAQQQAPQLIQTFVQQGLIVETEEGYKAIFTFKDQALMINDMQIPLPFNG